MLLIWLLCESLDWSFIVLLYMHVQDNGRMGGEKGREYKRRKVHQGEKNVSRAWTGLGLAGGGGPGRVQYRGRIRSPHLHLASC